MDGKGGDHGGEISRKAGGLVSTLKINLDLLCKN